MATVSRGKIQRGDLASWDGGAFSATRVDATGGTITGLPVGNEVDVLQTYGGGVTRSSSSIAVAIARIGSGNATMLLAPGTWTIDSSLTVPSNLAVRIPAGCILDIASGKTVTFNGHVYSDAAFTTGAGSYVLNANSVIAGRQMIATTAAELANSLTATNYTASIADPDFLETPERFGAVGDGVTNDKAAVQAAINSGKSVYFANTYFLGSYSTANTEVPVLTITGKSNVRYFGPGTLKVTSSNSCVPRIIDVDDSHDLTIDLKFTDTGYDSSVTYQGAIAVNLLCDTGYVYRINVKIRGQGLVGGFNTGNQNATTPNYSAINIHVEADLQDVYYGIQFRNCGDRVTGYCKTVTAHRSYFVYGAQDHYVTVISYDHPVGYPQDCLIKCYNGRNTRNINLKYSCTSFAALTACVYIGNETTNGKTTTDINVEVNDIDSSNSNSYSVFIASTTSGATDSTTTKVITGIKVSGHMRFVPHVATSFQNTDYRKQLKIELSGDVADKMLSIRPVVYGWSGTPMVGVTNGTYNTRWKIGGKIHVFYTGNINNGRIDVPLGPSQNSIVPVEMFIIDAVFASTGYQHKQMTYFASGASSVGGSPSVFASATDFNSTNGTVQTITQGTQVADSDTVAGIKFTFSGWTTAASGYIHFVHPDLSRDEVAN